MSVVIDEMVGSVEPETQAGEAQGPQPGGSEPRTPESERMRALLRRLERRQRRVRAD